jgi:hypothetical protein
VTSRAGDAVVSIKAIPGEVDEQGCELTRKPSMIREPALLPAARRHATFGA